MLALVLVLVLLPAGRLAAASHRPPGPAGVRALGPCRPGQPPAEAQPAAAQPVDAPPEHALQPPTHEQVMSAYRTLADWVRAAEFPAEPPADPPPWPSAVCVTFRLDGAVIGRGVDAMAGPGALWRAGVDAWRQAAARLVPVPDALDAAALRGLARPVTIGVELGGPFVPIVGDDYSALLESINPGLDGLAVRRGDEFFAMFPGAMISGGVDPIEGFRVLLSRAFEADRSRAFDETGAARRPAVLRAESRVEFYRFGTIHAAQPRAGDQPIFLHRGGRVVPVSSMTAAALRAFADGLAANLAARRWTGEGRLGMSGTADPARGIAPVGFAAPGDQAIAALALLRYTNSPGAARTDEAARIAAGLLSDLAVVEPGEPEPWADPATAAACVVACVEARRASAATAAAAAALIAPCRAAVDRAFEPDRGFADDLPPAAAGLVAWALVRLAVDDPPADRPAALDRARAAVVAVYALAGPDRLAAQMPWLGLADLELNPSGEPVGAVALRDLRDLVWSHQMTDADCGPDNSDLAGGIVFTSGRVRLPNWNTARPVAFLAAMVRDQRLTDAPARLREVTRVLASLRFLRQLAADDATGHMMRWPDRSRWGVRASLWDQRQPADATSITLLAVCEMLSSLEALSAPR